MVVFHNKFIVYLVLGVRIQIFQDVGRVDGFNLLIFVLKGGQGSVVNQVSGHRIIQSFGWSPVNDGEIFLNVGHPKLARSRR